MNLLVADDEAMIRKGILQLDWNSVGIQNVYSVKNGEEAKDLLLSTGIDIGLFDIRMPGLTGLDLARMIQERDLDTAVILLTGFSEFEYARDGIRYGVSEYLIKPMLPSELLSTVSRVARGLERRRKEREAVPSFRRMGSSDVTEEVIQFFMRQPEDILHVIRILCDRYADPDLSLTSVAESCYITPEYLSRHLKKETGHSYVNIVNAIRLTNALWLLARGSRVSEALEKAGYNDRAYFNSLIRKTFGQTPSDLKKHLEGNGMPFHRVMDLVENKRKDVL